jgi:hypothetical protein
MAGFSFRQSRLLFAGTLVAGIAGVAASPVAALADENAHVCSGSFTHPGLLTGSFSDVVVKGVCFVSAGPATVHDKLTVSRNGALVAAFGTGNSSLKLYGDLRVEDGGTAILGCDPQSGPPCFDDPNPMHPTLSSHTYVRGDLTADEPLGIIVHNTTIGGDVTETGGGGGFNCTPHGFFATPPPGPVFSAFEDSSIHGDLVVSGLRSCWLGIARVQVGGDVRVLNNQLADLDAIEILGNYVHDDLACNGNSMAWDSHELSFGPDLYPRANVPNKVSGERSGQCVRSTPTTMGGPFGPPGSF